MCVCIYISTIKIGFYSFCFVNLNPIAVNLALKRFISRRRNVLSYFSDLQDTHWAFAFEWTSSHKEIKGCLKKPFSDFFIRLGTVSPDHSWKCHTAHCSQFATTTLKEQGAQVTQRNAKGWNRGGTGMGNKGLRGGCFREKPVLTAFISEQQFNLFNRRRSKKSFHVSIPFKDDTWNASQTGTSLRVHATGQGVTHVPRLVQSLPPVNEETAHGNCFTAKAWRTPNSQSSVRYDISHRYENNEKIWHSIQVAAAKFDLVAYYAIQTWQDSVTHYLISMKSTKKTEMGCTWSGHL